jgi:hypothetical protein
MPSATLERLAALWRSWQQASWTTALGQRCSQQSGHAYKWMAGAFAVQDGLGCSRWLSSKPYISPYAILTAPMRLTAVKLPGALCNAAQAIDARLGWSSCHHGLIA